MTYLKIEIKKSAYVKGCFDYEEGDIVGKLGMYNSTKEQILEEISDKMEELK